MYVPIVFACTGVSIWSRERKRNQVGDVHGIVGASLAVSSARFVFERVRLCDSSRKRLANEDVSRFPNAFYRMIRVGRREREGQGEERKRGTKGGMSRTDEKIRSYSSLQDRGRSPVVLLAWLSDLSQHLSQHQVTLRSRLIIFCQISLIGEVTSNSSPYSAHPCAFHISMRISLNLSDISSRDHSSSSREGSVSTTRISERSRDNKTGLGSSRSTSILLIWRNLVSRRLFHWNMERGRAT